MKYITDYPKLCDRCQQTVYTLHGFMSEVDDIYQSDPEGIIMLMGDRQLFCEGHTCTNREKEVTPNVHS